MNNDLISREAVLKALRARGRELLKLGTSFESNIASVTALECVNIVKDAPAVDVAPVVHGRWIHCAGKSNLWHCSECGGRIMYNQTRKTYNIKKLPVSEANKFCRNCGAKMDGGAQHGSD